MMSPVKSLSSPHKMPNNVDLPTPLRPMMPIFSRSLIENRTFCMRLLGPKDFSVTTISAIIVNSIPYPTSVFLVVYRHKKYSATICHGVFLYVRIVRSVLLGFFDAREMDTDVRCESECSCAVDESAIGGKCVFFEQCLST